MMLSDTLKQSLQQGKAISGCTVSLFAPEMVEMLGLAGLILFLLTPSTGL